jgi:hypothetical protein
MQPIKKFLGVVNTRPPRKLPPGALTQADNVRITRDGSVVRRPGRGLVAEATKITSSYATSDNRYLFVVDSGTLFRFDGSGFAVMANGLPDAPGFWCEETPNRVFLMSSNAYLSIDNGTAITELHALPIPEDSGINDLAVNTELFPTNNVSALTFHSGSVVVSVVTKPNVSEIRFSIPQVHHLFHRLINRFEIADTVVAMESINGQLLIAAKNAFYSYTSDNRLIKLSEYGAIPGKSIAKLPENGCLAWTTRGVIKYPEFQNVTDAQVSLPPGSGCATALFDVDGDRYFLVSTNGAGVAYNAMN